MTQVKNSGNMTHYLFFKIIAAPSEYSNQWLVISTFISRGTQLHVTSFACFQVFQTHAMGPRQIIIYFKFLYIADITRCLVLLYSKQGRHHITQCFHLVGRSWFSLKKKVGICFNVQMLIHNKIYRVNISQITGFTAKSNATLPNIIKQNDNW